jgi:hypothetical protein
MYAGIEPKYVPMLSVSQTRRLLIKKVLNNLSVLYKHFQSLNSAYNMAKSTILEKLDKLPQSMQTEVLHYIDFLLEMHLKSKKQNLDGLQQDLQVLSEEEAEKRYGYGSMAGQIIMSDDFDEPLEELAEYQKC